MLPKQTTNRDTGNSMKIAAAAEQAIIDNLICERADLLGQVGVVDKALIDHRHLVEVGEQRHNELRRRIDKNAAELRKAYGLE